MDKYQLLSKGLRNNFIYSIGKLGLKWQFEGYLKEALLFFLNQSRKAYLGDKPVVWCSTFIPSELIYAIGGVPFMPEIAAGFTAALNLADDMLIEAETDWLNGDVCSIHRCGSGLTDKGLMPRPDLILASSHLCDGAKKYLLSISHKYNCPYYLLETPYHLSDAFLLADQLKDLVNNLDDNYNIDFQTAFSLSNQTYKYHRQINTIRQQTPALIAGEQILNLVPMDFMAFGSEGGLRYYKKLASFLKKHNRDAGGVVLNERIRLLWLHLKPYYPQKIFTTLRKMGVVIAFEEYSQLYWKPLAIAQPYLSLAKKMINHFGWGPLQRQFVKIDEMISNYQIDGVICFSQWGCRQGSGRTGLIKRHLKKIGIPCLNIDGDLVDKRNHKEGQLLTRFQAFIELIDQQKGVS